MCEDVNSATLDSVTASSTKDYGRLAGAHLHQSRNTLPLNSRLRRWILRKPRRTKNQEGKYTLKIERPILPARIVKRLPVERKLVPVLALQSPHCPSLISVSSYLLFPA